MANEEERTIRYAVVGLGWIAQEAVLPGFRNAKNSVLAALVSDDPVKARKLSKSYHAASYSYAEYDDLLKSGAVDAVYIALPNSLHAEYCLRAANARVHVLCEKPLATTSRECEEIIRAARDTGVKVMTAYRLHFEPANLRAVELVKSGKLGEPRVFSSIFCQQVQPDNVRLSKDLAGATLMDMGIYPINAARYLFRDEPEEAVAVGGAKGEERFKEVHEAVSAILRFPGDKLATFTCSFGAAEIDEWHVAGTRGTISLQPGFGYHTKLKLISTIEGRRHQETIPRHDQLGAEIVYFS